MAPPIAPDSPRWLPHLGLCSRRKRHTNRARLRMRSLPGVFLLLGAVVVLVGTAMAVLSYWPHRANRSALLGHVGPGKSLDKPPVARRGPGARSALSAGGTGHHDRMRLLGPVIMGVGLFILICANTVLFENRDHDTRLRFREAQGPRRGISATVPTVVHPARCRWMTKPSIAKADILCAGHLLDSLAPPGAAALLVCSQDALCASSRVPGSTDHRASPAEFHPEPPPLPPSSSADLKPDRRLETRSKWDAAVPPRRSYSLGCRTIPASSVLGDKDSKDDTDIRGSASRSFRRETSSSVCVNVAELSFWSPGNAEEWSRSSWPRLDFDGAVTSWESKRESMDRLLD